MYKALLAQQWKHQRVEITALAIGAAVTCPGCAWINNGLDPQTRPWMLMDTGAPIAVIGSLAALFTGLLLAFRPFVLDNHTRHTYALALPVPRPRYALLRAAGGLTLALIPVAAFLIGAELAGQLAPPNGMIHAYPIQLTVRFLLATAFAFAFGFGVQYGLGRRATRWAMIVVFTLAGAEALGALSMHVSVTGPLWSLLAHDGSPLRVYLSEWTLFNV
jgi:hypothetical protein